MPVIEKRPQLYCKRGEEQYYIMREADTHKDYVCLYPIDIKKFLDYWGYLPSYEAGNYQKYYSYGDMYYVINDPNNMWLCHKNSFEQYWQKTHVDIPVDITL